MAKESMKAKERKREKLAAQFNERRKVLRKAQSEGDWDAMFKLQKLPKNSMGVRKHNRCQLTGRPRGYMRQFGISRVTFREMAVAGKIPGVTKASW
ncbi:MAG: 30S ribosomal protein S14 [Flavobacteriales bacterium]